MAIQYEGYPLNRVDLRAALFRCTTCHTSTLYQRGFHSGASAEFVATSHVEVRKSLGEDHSVILKGYIEGEPWPEADIDDNTVFMS